jgi:hypothetical protein
MGWPPGTPRGGGRRASWPERGVTVSLGDPIYKAVLPVVFAEGVGEAREGAQHPRCHRRHRPALERGHASPGRPPGDRAHHDGATATGGPTTCCSSPTAPVAALDFQLIGTARGTYDLAYFVTQSLDRSTATEHERALFDRWVSAVEGAGVPPEDNATAWDDYRQGALFCLVYPVVAWRGMDAGDPRQVGLASTMLDRFARAARSSTWPPCSEGTPGGSEGPRRTLASRNPQAI